MQLLLQGISFIYPTAPEAVFKDITVTFPTGWTGIVGPNGSGKSTLALLAAGILSPATGSIMPKLTSSYCLQETTYCPEDACDLINDYSREALRIRSQFDIADDWPGRFDTLSLGERKRLQIATALFRNPDVLIVDEPTNHLDALARIQLAEMLKTFRGIGLLISHDRALLDELTSQTLFIEDGTVILRSGSYQKAYQQAQLERQEQLREHDEARREYARLHKEHVRRAETASHTNARRSGRHLDKHDSSGRETLRLAVVSGQDGKAGRLSGQMEHRLKLAGERVESSYLKKHPEGNVWLKTAPSRRKTLVSLPACVLPLGDNRHLRVDTLTVGNTDHIAIVGSNGTGKSSLIRYMIDRIPSDERLLYIEQEPGPVAIDVFRTLFDHLPADEKGHVLSIVAQLGSKPRALLTGESVSPGELRKLMLATGMIAQPEIIVMDEPTNHLDIGSLVAMQRVLADCPCALVVVSHDDAFVQATTHIQWRIQRKNNEEEIIVVS